MNKKLKDLREKLKDEDVTVEMTGSHVNVRDNKTGKIITGISVHSSDWCAERNMESQLRQRFPSFPRRKQGRKK